MRGKFKNIFGFGGFKYVDMDSGKLMPVGV